jgi:hypothetical protein
MTATLYQHGVEYFDAGLWVISGPFYEAPPHQSLSCITAVRAGDRKDTTRWLRDIASQRKGGRFVEVVLSATKTMRFVHHLQPSYFPTWYTAKIFL